MDILELPEHQRDFQWRRYLRMRAVMLTGTYFDGNANQTVPIPEWPTVVESLHNGMDVLYGRNGNDC